MRQKSFQTGLSPLTLLAGLGCMALAVSGLSVNARPVPLSLMPSATAPSYGAAKARAAHGDREAEYWMGEYAAGYQRDQVEPAVDYVTAMAWFMKSKAKGYKPAVFPLSYLQAQQADYDNHRVAAEGGNPQAEYDFSLYLKATDPGWHRQDAPATWRHRAADHGQSDAEYENGEDALAAWQKSPTDENLTAAFLWFERAAEQGQIRAQEQLFEMYSEQTSRKNTNKAIAWLQRLAYQDLVIPVSQSDPNYDKFWMVTRALDNLCRYYEGEPINAFYNNASSAIAGHRDDASAFECNQHFAKSTTPWGEYALGYDYQYGVGTSVDEDKAMSVYLTAVRNKDSSAQYFTLPMIRLALLYDGRGEYESAYLWLKIAEDSITKKLEANDAGSPEVAHTPYTPEVQARLKVYSLGAAALTRLRQTLTPEILAHQDALAATMVRDRVFTTSLWAVY